MRNKLNKHLVLGLMSGTSCDGLDMALCTFSDDLNQWSIIDAKTLIYPPEIQEFLHNLSSLSARELLQYHIQYAKFSAAAVNEFIKDLPKPNLIVSHGHTVFHTPESGLTFQLGHGGVLHQGTGIPVVSDLRVEDVALGGQGAPLVPKGDVALFPGFDIWLNLGGFANMSFLDSDRAIRAFDICALNIVLNGWAKKLGLPFDAGGKMASQGTINIPLLEKLNALSIYSSFPRPSLAQEWVSEVVSPLFPSDIHPIDALATYTIHAASVIADALRMNGPAKVLASGGGVWNEWLIHQIERRSGQEIIIPSDEVVNFKEALIFAWLGLRRIKGLSNVSASVTGASADSSSGAIWGSPFTIS